MGGSQLGMVHIYAEARHRDFVREAEHLGALRVAASGQTERTGSRILRMRAVTGGLLIGLGERIRGGHAGDATPAPASGLRLAR